jgi:hypothetical protein
MYEPAEKQQSMLEQAKSILTQSITERASLAFQDVTTHLRTPEELRDTLGVSESLLEDLRYVRNNVECCFPNHYNVFDMYLTGYSEVILKRLRSYLGY